MNRCVSKIELFEKERNEDLSFYIELNIFYFMKFGFCMFILLLFLGSCNDESPLNINNNDDVIIDGYFSKISASNGDSLDLFINSKKRITKPLINVYNSNGVVEFKLVLDFIGPQRISNDKPYENGYGYKLKNTFKIPIDLKSGYYLVANKIPLIVKNRDKNGKIAVVYPTNTENAYNVNGGMSMYSQSTRATISSFLRPQTRLPFTSEFLKWSLNKNIDYISDLDMDEYLNIEKYKLIIIIGHSEYWSRQARINFDRFVEKGNNALILSGNTMWWQIRYSEDNTKMICYKSVPEPDVNLLYRTVNWDYKILNYPIINSIGSEFSRGGYGTKKDDGWDGYKILKADSPLLKGTNLEYEDIISCPSVEYDGSFIKYDSNYSHPILNKEKLNFYKSELIGYDYGVRTDGGYKTSCSFIVFQKTSSTGVVVNVGSTDWCSNNGMGGKNGEVIKKITSNAIYLLTNNLSVF